MLMNQLARTPWIRILTSALCAFFLSGPAPAGEFTVDPIRLELWATARSGMVSVRNDGTEKLSFQLEGMEWTQDNAGQDQYTETRDLIFFPKIMTVEPGHQGVIRVGVKHVVVATEKTYRLFINELPGVLKKPEAPGAQINVLIRFGAPIFVAPAKAEDRLEVEALSLAKGTLNFSARNGGNRHQMVQGIQLTGVDGSGNTVYALTLTDRYLLAGTVKLYTTAIPAADCSRIASLQVEVKTDKASANRKLDVTRSLCS